MISKEYINSFSSSAGVYIFYDEKTPIYIGKAVNIKARLLSHLQNSKLDHKEEAILKLSSNIEIQETISEFDALLLEAKLIRQYQPKYNLILKDDKSYLYIKVSVKDLYPKISAVRRENDGKSLYFGPFESTRLTNYIVRQIRKIVPFCTQKNLSKQPCFYSKIGQCNPCPNLIEQVINHKEKIALQKKYKKNIQLILKILSGRYTKVLDNFEKELQYAIENDEFEKGIILRNKIQILKNFLFSRSFYTEKFKNGKDFNVLASDFDKFLLVNFDVNPSYNIADSYRIECYDISNLFGKEATGSMVVFEGGKSAKDQYRRFKIKTVKNISDFDMIEEVFKRRFARNDWRMPDLIVVDGGTPQLRKVSTVLKEFNLNIPHIGIAKNPDRIIFPQIKKRPIRLLTPKPIFNLICEIRDEAHRFAKKYHLYLRSKRIMV